MARVPGRREFDWQKQLDELLANLGEQTAELPGVDCQKQLDELLAAGPDPKLDELLVDQGAWVGPLLELDFGPSQEQLDEMERQMAELLAKLVREDGFWQAGPT